MNKTAAHKPASNKGPQNRHGHLFWQFAWQLLPLLTDALSFAAALVASYHLRFKFIDYTTLPPFSEYISAILPFTVLMLAAFHVCSAYKPFTCFTAEETWSVLQGAVIGALFIMSASFMYRGFSYSRLVLVGAVAISALLSLIFRMSVRESQTRAYRKGKNLTRTGIIGESINSDRLLSRLGTAEHTGRIIAGFITKDGGKSSDLRSADRKVLHSDLAVGDMAHTGQPVEGGTRCNTLGTLERIEDIAAEHSLDEIIITIPYVSRTEVYDIVSKLEALPLRIAIIPDMYELITDNAEFDVIGGVPVLEVRVIRLRGFNAVLKRVFDIVLSAVGLLFLLPFLGLIALCVKLTSPGPVLYRQERIGLDGRSFTMLKFRSMRVDAETKTGPVWAVENDPRRTAFGSFLRRYSIDELPQLWNVLIGDMSLVGPRPERPFFVEQFQQAIPRYMVRHRVLCGITGWAQVNGLRGDTSIEDRTRYDLWYVENWSLGLDIRILLRTVFELAGHKTAY